jgi:hypothetical protein
MGNDDDDSYVYIRVAEFALFARFAGFTRALYVLFDVVAPASRDF